MTHALKHALTVEQIARDTLTKISNKYWSQSSNEQLAEYEAKLIDDIYLNEILGSKFSLKRIMLLEFSQYLERYLWKNYKAGGQVSIFHVLSIVIMVNEKFRERVFAWECFINENTTEFGDFFNRVLKLCLDKFENKDVNLSYQEQSILIKFLDNCINSLEIDLIRIHVQKICGLPMWISLNENRREHEFSKHTKLRKFWKAIEKNDSKLSHMEKINLSFERTFFRNLISKFLKIIQSNFDNMNKIEDKIEIGEILDDRNKKVPKDKHLLHYVERFLELIIDLEALLPTRRFFNTLLDDSNMLIHCHLSDLIQCKILDQSGQNVDDYNLFKNLFNTLKFYVSFEIDDQTGEAISEAKNQEYHYDKLKSLQKGKFN